MTMKISNVSAEWQCGVSTEMCLTLRFRKLPMNVCMCVYMYTKYPGARIFMHMPLRSWLNVLEFQSSPMYVCMYVLELLRQVTSAYAYIHV